MLPQNTRLHAFLQTAIYVHFLKSQENDTDSYKDKCSLLHDLRLSISHVAETLGGLLPTVACDDIDDYVVQDVNKQFMLHRTDDLNFNRFRCYCALELMRAFFYTSSFDLA